MSNPTELPDVLKLFEQHISTDPEAFLKPGITVYQITADEVVAFAADLARRAQPEGEAPEAADERVDGIVTGLYHRFKGWSKRGFGADDVTWCEVKADVIALIAAQQAAAHGDIHRDAKRFQWIEDNCTTRGGGNGFTIFVPVDHEDIGCGIDEAIEKGN